MHPNELLYSQDHIWCKKEPDGSVRVGMTYHYQRLLNNIVYVDMQKIGTHIKRGEPFASLESSKTAADLTSPLGGIVLEANPLLLEKPGLMNKDPYGQGWIILIKPSHPEELELLLSAMKYIDLVAQ
jgi:glycine cleavage system H protein